MLFTDFRRRLAARISPELACEVGELKAKTILAEDIAAASDIDCSRLKEQLETAQQQVTVYKAANADYAKRLSISATAIAAHIELHRRRCDALRVAMGYVLDAADDLDHKLDTLSPRSKKRIPLEATRAAVYADLETLRSAINDGVKT